MENHDFNINVHRGPMSAAIRGPVRRIRILGDYQLHGVIIRRVIKKPAYVKPPQFEHILFAYDAECERNNYSKRGMRTKMQRLYFFIDYITSRKLQDVKDITPVILSDYVKTIFRYHEKSISAILTTLRTFLKFLYLNEYIEKDLSLDVPKPKKHYYPPIPSIWKTEDVKKMLESVDRGSPIGKRDYAILLLVAKLGIRVGDLKALKLHDLNWNTKTIELNQSKTVTGQSKYTTFGHLKVHHLFRFNLFVVFRFFKRGFGFISIPIAQTIAFTLKRDDVGMLQQAVKDGSGRWNIADKLAPVFYGAVAGHNG